MIVYLCNASLGKDITLDINQLDDAVYLVTGMTVKKAKQISISYREVSFHTL